jgi:gluconolactonase
MKFLRIVGVLFCLSAIGTAAAQRLPGEREVRVEGIPGVVEAGAEWQLVWADFVTADGIVGTSDGGVVFAQEQTDRIVKLDAAGREHTYVANTRGAGAVSLDTQGRLFAAQRTCTEPLNTFLPGCDELTNISILSPTPKLLANSFADGATLGRVNDVMADGQGGAYFTAGGAYHVDANGRVTTVEDQDLRSNGIMLSRDGRTLYVTNQTVVIAFDVAPDGATGNRRDFATLDGDGGGDGMAIDAQGRLYVTGNAGVHVISEEGRYLGLIPTPRRPITLAFAGRDKRTLYVPQMGAVGPDGKAWSTPEGIRNTAMTIYTLDMTAAGFAGRPK